MTRAASARDDRGMITIWVLGAGFGILAFIGLIVVDGGTVLRTRSEAFTVAGAAARAGAQVLEDTPAVFGDVRVDSAKAEAAARGYLSARGYEGSVSVTGDRVTVTVNDVADLAIYPGAVPVNATATAVALEPGGSP